MIISWREVRHLERLIDRLERTSDSKVEVIATEYFAERPHLLMPTGFDEYVGFTKEADFAHMWFANGCSEKKHSIYRQPGGRWLHLAGAAIARDDSFYFDSKENVEQFRNSEEQGLAAVSYELEVALEDLFTTLYKVASEARHESEEILWSPKLWTPDRQEAERLALVRTVHPILEAFRLERVSFEKLSWRQLEELVAETLRRSGLEIHVVREHPQHGRDIIARTQLVPGQEPLQIAIEVKHKPVVYQPDLAKAFHNNRHYPALMLVTSGQFSAGILKEKNKPENAHRLFLKDGAALGDLIRDYL